MEIISNIQNKNGTIFKNIFIMFKIKELREQKKLTQKEFSEKIGIDNSQLSKIEQGKMMPTLSQLMEISSKFDVSLDWITGKSSMLKEEKKEVQQPKKKSEYSLEDLKSIARGELKVPKHQEQTRELQAFSSPKGYPLLPFDAFAGIGTDLEGINFDVIEERYVIPLFDGIKVDFMISVRGSSMYPKYSSGDVVACRLVKDILFFQWNKVYVLDTQSQGVIMKRVKKSSEEGCITCVSENSNYDPFDIPMEDVRNIALVVGVIRLE